VKLVHFVTTHATRPSSAKVDDLLYKPFSQSWNGFINRLLGNLEPFCCIGKRLSAWCLAKASKDITVLKHHKMPEHYFQLAQGLSVNALFHGCAHHLLRNCLLLFALPAKQFATCACVEATLLNNVHCTDISYALSSILAVSTPTTGKTAVQTSFSTARV